MSTENKKNDFIEGLSVGTSFLTVSLFVYLRPEFLYNTLLSHVIGLIVGIVGFIGIMIELNKKNKNYREGADDITIGGIIIIIIILLNKYLHFFVVHLVILILLFLAVYGILLGIFKMLKNVYKQGKKAIIFKIPIFIMNCCVFILTILQLIKILNLI